MLSAGEGVEARTAAAAAPPAMHGAAPRHPALPSAPRCPWGAGARTLPSLPAAQQPTPASSESAIFTPKACKLEKRTGRCI